MLYLRRSFIALALVPGCFQGNPGLAEDSTSSTSDGSSASSTGPGAAESGTRGGSTTGATSTTGAADSTTSGASGSSTEAVVETSSGPWTTSTSTGEPADCAREEVCLSPPPPPWAGPVLLADTTDKAPDLACPEGSEGVDLSLHSGLEANSSECSCSCGSAEGVQCGSTTLEFHGDDASCGSANASFPMTYAGSGGTCAAGPNGGSGSYWRAEPLGVSGGTCLPNASESVPEASWNTDTTICDVDVSILRSCEFDGVCADEAGQFSAGHCVWQEGDHSCEGLELYTEKELRWTGLADDRGCSACGCDAPEGQCAGEVWLYAGASCSDSIDRIDTDGGCHESGISVGSALLRESAAGCGGPCQVLVSASCAPEGGEPVGSATPASPYTFCCTG